MAPSISTRLLEGEALSDRSRPLAIVTRRWLIRLRNDSRVGPLGHGIVPPVGRCDMRIESPCVMRTFKGVGILWPRPFRHPEFLLLTAQVLRPTTRVPPNLGTALLPR